MKKFFLSFLITSLVVVTPYTQESSTPQKTTGEGAAQGTTSAATIAWATVGVAFIVAIGIIIAVTINRDHNNQTVVISH